MTKERPGVAGESIDELIAEAYRNDREGREREAIRYYDEAYRLGVPEAQRKRFLIGYGSTLRNVHRADDAVGILAEAVAEFPDDPAFGAFLALALLDAGHPRAALAAMLGCALDAARSNAFDGYERALGEYHRALLEPSQS
jgi:predicted Zn-dependent protease